MTFPGSLIGASRRKWAQVALGIGLLAQLPPFSAPQRQFELVSNGPIHQSLTRVAFFHRTPTSGTIYFSTLEANRSRATPNQFLWCSVDSLTATTQTRIVHGSVEARSYAYSSLLDAYVLGSSLRAQILLFDPENQTMRTVFRAPATAAWIHSVAVAGDRVHAMLSGSGKPSGFDGILEINLTTGKHRVTPFRSESTQVYGGVETVDPTGRVWFYRAYPMEQMWADAAHGIRPRRIPGHEGWNVESWDQFNGSTYLILSDQAGVITKRQANLSTLELLDIDQSAPRIRQFLSLIPVDLYHKAGPALQSLYVDPITSSFFTRDDRLQEFSPLGAVPLGTVHLAGAGGKPQESAVVWRHVRFGEIEVLGFDGQDLILWFRGQKTYGRGNLRSGEIRVQPIPVQNLSTADITSLVSAKDGNLYGAGYLTMSDLFRFNPTEYKTELLPSAIPFGEGQTNAMFVGLDGLIYGVGYPDSVLFKFDPSLPWSPGAERGSNPLNLGPMRHHNQARAYRGVQALDGSIWMQSTSDDSATVVHALARAAFDHRSLTVKTDIDDGMPRVRDLAVFDRQHVLLLGEDSRGPALFLLDQGSFRVVKSRRIGHKEGALNNIDPADPLKRGLLLSQGPILYKVTETLSLERLHQSPGPILRVVPDRRAAMFLIGQNFIEWLDLESGRSRVARPRGQKAGGRVFSDLHWKPVTAHGGRVFFGDGPELWRFTPLRNCESPSASVSSAGC